MESHWDRLPEHLQDHIKSFIPLTCMPLDLQEDIKTQSAIFKINKMDNLWADFRSSHQHYIRWSNWSETEYHDYKQIRNNLRGCGCCVRHSGFKRDKKLGKCLENKLSSTKVNLECKCACRHWCRNMNRNGIDVI